MADLNRDVRAAMADRELIKILKQGPHVWNEWRSKQLDLSGVIRPPDTDLTGINLMAPTQPTRIYRACQATSGRPPKVIPSEDYRGGTEGDRGVIGPRQAPAVKITTGED